MAVEGFDLTGKKALVIGAGSSAGRAVALALAEAGADVAVTSTSSDGDDAAAASETARLLGKTDARRIDATSSAAGERSRRRRDRRARPDRHPRDLPGPVPRASRSKRSPTASGSASSA